MHPSKTVKEMGEKSTNKWTLTLQILLETESKMKLAQHVFSLFINRGGIPLQTTGGWRGGKMGVKKQNHQKFATRTIFNVKLELELLTMNFCRLSKILNQTMTNNF